jgi:hypothetical protein
LSAMAGPMSVGQLSPRVESDSCLCDLMRQID